jgi:hypothetical protein
MRCQVRSLAHGAELRPHDVLRDVAEPGGGIEASVCARDDPVRVTDTESIPADPIGDDLGMLDVLVVVSITPAMRAIVRRERLSAKRGARGRAADSPWRARVRARAR